MTATLAFTLAFEKDLLAADLFSRGGSVPATPPVAPPSGTVLAMVRQFGEAEERDDGLTLYRLTAAQLANADMASMLGAERERALDIALLWDDREEELVEVIDDAKVRAPAPTLSYADLKVRGDRRTRHPRFARAA